MIDDDLDMSGEEIKQRLAKLRIERYRMLNKRVMDERIPIDNNITKYTFNKKYSMRDAFKDYHKINKAIDNAISEDRLHEVPPPIVAIVVSAQGVPLVYYIKNDLSENRKRKSVKPKSSRKICKCKK